MRIPSECNNSNVDTDDANNNANDTNNNASAELLNTNKRKKRRRRNRENADDDIICVQDDYDYPSFNRSRLVRHGSIAYSDMQMQELIMNRSCLDGVIMFGRSIVVVTMIIGAGDVEVEFARMFGHKLFSRVRTIYTLSHACCTTKKKIKDQGYALQELLNRYGPYMEYMGAILFHYPGESRDIRGIHVYHRLQIIDIDLKPHKFSDKVIEGVYTDDDSFLAVGDNGVSIAETPQNVIDIMFDQEDGFFDELIDDNSILIGKVPGTHLDIGKCQV